MVPSDVTGFSWNSGNLPRYLSLDSTTGQLSGTPDASDEGEGSRSTLQRSVKAKLIMRHLRLR
ncbi:Ig domain-containing protein [Halomonas massiliensis]|uniref:Ig domain-containing protein n=1 Tax=Vreelandella massiliensis TaxID=1816686 RepID=UPI0009F94F80